MFPNLNAEKARNRLTNQDFSNTLNISVPSINNKMSGKTEFTRREMITLRDKYFSGMSLEYLFDDVPLDKQETEGK